MFLYWVWDPMAGGDSRVFEATPGGLTKAITHAQRVGDNCVIWGVLDLAEGVVVRRIQTNRDTHKGRVVWRWCHNSSEYEGMTS
jgi:hypothetical protein